VGTFTELPFTVSYDDIDGLLDGLNGVTKNSLRLQDQFIFSTYVTTTSGDVFKVSPGMAGLTIPINCLSDLAGKYSVAGTSQSGDSDTWETEVVETAPGEYYYLPSSADMRDRGYTIALVFNDVCNEIVVPSQNMGGEVEGSDQFSNAVEGAGSVNTDTGVITIEYTIENLGTQTEVLTPID
jgi:hypothetical protein